MVPITCDHDDHQEDASDKVSSQPGLSSSFFLKLLEIRQQAELAKQGRTKCARGHQGHKAHMHGRSQQQTGNNQHQGNDPHR